MADITIMARQMAIIFGGVQGLEMLNAEIERKLTRLAGRVDTDLDRKVKELDAKCRDGG